MSCKWIENDKKAAQLEKRLLYKNGSSSLSIEDMSRMYDLMQSESSTMRVVSKKAAKKFKKKNLAMSPARFYRISNEGLKKNNATSRSAY